MACGNNMISSDHLQSSPVPIAMPVGSGATRPHLSREQVATVQHQTRAAMDQAERRAASAMTATAASEAVKEAQRALDTARRMRGPANERASLIRELERRLERMKKAAVTTEGHQQTEGLATRAQQEHGAVMRFQTTDRLSRMQLGVPSHLAAQSTPSVPIMKNDSRQSDSINYLRLPGASGGVDDAQFGPALEDAWAQSYHTATDGKRDVVAFTVGSFTWLWDATPVAGEVENRLIGVYGRSDPQGLPRDQSRMQGFPSPQRDHTIRVDRGHAAGHSLGGPDEGWNLFPQVADVNRRGHWRELEKYCTDHPGTFMFMRAVYSGNSDEPDGLEYGVVDQGGQLTVDRFNNL
jgi:hypothetical protein